MIRASSLQMIASIFVAAIASVLVSETLDENSVARNLLHAAWILVPYLVLITVTVVFEKRTSLLATAIATLFGSVGALASVVMMTVFEAGLIGRLVPLCQAGAIGVLLPTCRWIIVRIDTDQSPK